MSNIVEQLNPKHLLNIFKGRSDRLVLYARGKVISQQIKRGDFELAQRLEAHIGGSVRAGFYNMLDDNSTYWAIINFAEGGPVKNVARDSVMVMRELNKLGFRSARRERTMLPIEEYNIWLFFDRPIHAKKVRYFLYTFLDKLGLSKDIPIMPTSDELNPGSAGHYMWLPYFNGIDKWFDDEGEPYICKGIKDNQTVFIDNEGNTIEKSVLVIPRSTEADIDQALLALTGPMGKKYIPGVGLNVTEQVFDEMVKSCPALSNMMRQINETGWLSDDGIIRLGALLRGMGLEKSFQKYVSKLSNYDPIKFETNFLRYIGPTYPSCLDLKQTDFCAPGKNCMPKRSSLREHMGAWKEDPKTEKMVDPTLGITFFKLISEMNLEEAEEEQEAVTVVENNAVSTDTDEVSIIDAEEEIDAVIQRRAPLVVGDVQSIESFINNYEASLIESKGAFDTGKKQIGGLTTGFEALNEALDGLIPGTLITLAGPPGAGKTSFAKQILDTVADKDKVPCVFFSYDLSSEQLYRKTLARLSGVSINSIMRGQFSDEDWANITKVNAYMRKVNGKMIYLVEADEKLNAEAISNIIQKTGAKFVVVDYIQAMPAPAWTASADPDAWQRTAITDLKRVARKFHIPVVAVSNGKLTSGILYGTDILLQLYAQAGPTAASSSKQPYAILLNVEKNREGRSLFSLQYTFFPPRMTFYGEKKIEYRPIKL